MDALKAVDQYAAVDAHHVATNVVQFVVYNVRPRAVMYVVQTAVVVVRMVVKLGVETVLVVVVILLPVEAHLMAQTQIKLRMVNIAHTIYNGR